MPDAGAARRSRLIITGFCSISCVSATIGGGIVAEKKSVCLRGGRCFSTRLMSGRKPMSSMRSASSSTSTSRPVERGVGEAEVVEQAAGRRDDHVDALRKACSCGPMPTPPNTAAPTSGVCGASAFRCSSIWAASSRVGVSTSARVSPRGLPIEAVQDRQHERRGLAAARHRAGEQVLPLERGRQRLLLDRRRARESELADAARGGRDGARTARKAWRSFLRKVPADVGDASNGAAGAPDDHAVPERKRWDVDELSAKAVIALGGTAGAILRVSLP
jgi:hypothetical protein